MDLSGPTHQQMISKAAQNAARLKQHLEGQAAAQAPRSGTGTVTEQTALLLNDAVGALSALVQVLAKESDQL